MTDLGDVSLSDGYAGTVCGGATLRTTPHAGGRIEKAAARPLTAKMATIARRNAFAMVVMGGWGDV